MQAREPLDLETARQMLHHISSDDRETWVQVGKSLAAEFGPAAEGIYLEWSEQAKSFKLSSFKNTWQSCLRNVGGYTAGTLVGLALRGGFEFKRRNGPVPPEVLARHAQMRAEAEARRAAEAAEREVAVVSAQARARQQWRAASREGASVYAERKGITQPESCRFAANGALLVPMVRPDLAPEHALRGLQSISPDGTKRFTKGMDKVGTCCRLGALHEVGAPLLLCEGWATGGSIRAALRRLNKPLPVFVCFDAGSVGVVSALLARLHPQSPQVLCADDDWQTVDAEGRPLNPGRVAASAARDAVLEAGGLAVSATPVFRRGREPGFTDFNDLHLAEGIAAVTEQIALALQVLSKMGD